MLRGVAYTINGSNMMKISARLGQNVGGGLPPMAVHQSPDAVTDTLLSGASPLPHWIGFPPLLRGVAYTINDSNMIKIST
ncbi:hypothetical protein C4J94_4212 [Pseudomonas sp. R5-89-07]|nr:hypothetical protein C4J94_4212 [Pseudomonas sp. R5-89-07]